MKHARLKSTIIGLTVVALFALPALAQEPVAIPQRGMGLAVTFPLALLPAGTTPATVLLDLIAQGQLSQDVVHRLELRFFFHFLTGFRTDLTALRGSLLVNFTPSPAIFYTGGGVGVFPIQGVPAGTADGLLFSLFVRTGIEVQVAPLGLFLDVSYETMPQPFTDISAAGTLVASAIQLSVGALIHF
jgi:hypothetical protein